MKTHILLILTIISFTFTYPQITRTVCLSGTKDFISIQVAINASAFNGDTVRVYNGKYDENINFNGRNVYLTSLYKYSGNRNDIINTIIDGNQLCSVVRFVNNESRNAVINGFTIRNGIGHGEVDWSHGQINRNGAGIEVLYASPSIKNCIIENNHNPQGFGGGISLAGLWNRLSTPLLSGNIIRNNSASTHGGGIVIHDYVICEFDIVNLNSIYNNVAGWGHDISVRNGVSSQIQSIYLDMFTNIQYHEYFIYYHEHRPDSYTFSAKSSQIMLIDNDLFVATNGCDVNNTGLSFNSPFQTVSHAMRLIAPNLNNRNTVYVSSGHYSKSLNNQHFPVIMKPYVNLVGISPNTTIFDANFNIGLISGTMFAHNFAIKNISFKNTGNHDTVSWLSYAVSLSNKDGVLIVNCHFLNNGWGAISTNRYDLNHWHNIDSKVNFKNLLFDDNKKSSFSLAVSEVIMENIIAKNQKPYRRYIFGQHIINFSQPIIDNGNNLYDGSHIPRDKMSITNLLAYNNEKQHHQSDGSWRSLTVSILRTIGNILINHATIVNNSSSTTSPSPTPPNWNAVMLFDNGSNSRIYNSIIYDNNDNIIILNVPPLHLNPEPVHLYVNNTLIPNGTAAFMNVDNVWTNLHWGNGNIPDKSPMFSDCEEFPFSLSSNSPCIGAGTSIINWANYTPPTTDVFGRPRNPNRVDIGAVAYMGDGNFPQFQANPLTGNAPLEVQFTDLSYGNITSWQWNFDADNGNVTHSTLQNPTHIFENEGVYSIRLTINEGEHTLLKSNYISVLPPLIQLSFTAEPTSGFAPLTVHLTDTSEDDRIETTSWDFGNTGVIDVHNEINTRWIIQNAGTYSVRMVVNNGEAELVKRDLITVLERPPVPIKAVLVSPPNLETEVSLKPIFEWEESDRADKYRVYVSLSNVFTSVKPDTVEVLTFTPKTPLLHDTKYYWRVIPFNAGGDADGEHIIWSFTTINEPILPPDLAILVSPLDLAIDIPLTPIFEWEESEGADKYRVYISQSNIFTYVKPDTVEVLTFIPKAPLLHNTKYYWRVIPFNDSGDADGEHIIWSFTTVNDVSEEPNTLPIFSTRLIGNHPNPFNPETTIVFSLGSPSNVTIEIYNIRGMNVATIINRHLNAGNHSVIWNGKDDLGRDLGSGLYFYRMVADGYISTRRMLLLK